MLQKIKSSSDKAVALWLMVGVGMIIIQILLGGVTRLTGSGLSITEWDVITGTLPPLNEQQWIVEFEKYKQTPQFHLLNSDFTSEDFKFIFFWEWLHRFWARLIGVVFIIPFLIFLIQKRFKPEMVKPLVILFLLGALQGVVGWIMVASGLSGDAIYVKPTRLALHFILAMGLLSYTFWFALQLLVPAEKKTFSPALKKAGIWILVLLTMQFVYGAFMAGHKAATAAATWPDINGELIPGKLFNGGWLGLLEDKITIHFIHRFLAYVIFVFIIIWTIQLRKLRGSALLQKISILPFMLVLAQVALGIFSTLTSLRIVPNQWGLFEWMAQLHQLVAMFLMLSIIWVIYLLSSRTGKTIS